MTVTGGVSTGSIGDAPAPDGSRLRRCLVLFGLGVLTICTSAGMICFNKYLIHKGRFPYATPLMCIHMLVSAFLSGVLYLVAPSLYPSLSDPESRKQISLSLYTRGIIPIGAFFVGQLVLSNTAYLYSSVAFLQMMKEGNIVLVYILSIAVALEKFRLRNVAVLLCIVAATIVSVEGDVHFSVVGFCVQGGSQLNETLKIVLQGVLLTGSGVKLDALSYVFLMTPVAFAFLAALLVVLYCLQWQHMPVPASSEYIQWLPLILLNACLAFVLNVVTSLFMKNSSPVAYIIMGVVKDACIVLGGAAVFSEALSRQQLIGFAFQLIFISLWMAIKVFPEYFEDGVAVGILRLLSGRSPPAAKGEKGQV